MKEFHFNSTLLKGCYMYRKLISQPHHRLTSDFTNKMHIKYAHKYRNNNILYLSVLVYAGSKSLCPLGPTDPVQKCIFSNFMVIE